MAGSCRKCSERLREVYNLERKIVEMNAESKNLRRLIAAILLVHGIGHAGGYWMLRQSWLSESLAAGGARWLFVGLWLVAGLGFLTAGGGLLARKPWWRRLAIISSLVSLPSTFLYFGPNLNLTGALLVDLGILGGLLWAHWPKPAQIGA